MVKRHVLFVLFRMDCLHTCWLPFHSTLLPIYFSYSFLSFLLLSFIQDSPNPCINVIFVCHTILFYFLKSGFSNLTVTNTWGDFKNTVFGPHPSWSEVSKAPLGSSNGQLGLRTTASNWSMTHFLRPRCSKCGPRASSSITWKLVRIVDSQSHPRPTVS